MKEMQPGDVPYTAAETISLENTLSLNQKHQLIRELNYLLNGIKIFICNYLIIYL